MQAAAQRQLRRTFLVVLHTHTRYAFSSCHTGSAANGVDMGCNYHVSLLLDMQQRGLRLTQSADWVFIVTQSTWVTALTKLRSPSRQTTVTEGCIKHMTWHLGGPFDATAPTIIAPHDMWTESRLNFPSSVPESNPSNGSPALDSSRALGFHYSGPCALRIESCTASRARCCGAVAWPAAPR